TTDPLYHAGAYYVQEASSMFLSQVIQQLIPERNNLRVLDLCAAPGGKSTLIASLLEKDSLLISNEVIRTRASILEENITRWGYMNTWVTSNDPKDFSKLKGYFDIIVVDAPCSGSGLFRKDERALDEWSEANVQLCAQRQQRILADVWPALKENGILMYATCSYSPQEDEEILDWLGDDFEVASLPVQLSEEWGVVETTSAKHQFKGYRFFPHKVQGEGFFIAAVRKNNQESEL
ncbi:MAG: RsmB/NOP family class I SAM-dependent RNA methyltransferase, partial [Taibaiella sp.]|nr:RsmB/NOP family class I SAM-dependent RNA methyltransferase [Taibaiella sp.]